MTSIDWDKCKRFWDGTGPTAGATAQWERECKFGRERELRDRMVGSLMSDLYYAGKVGRAAAEFNLEKAGLIEMIQGHRPGVFREELTTTGAIAGGRSPSAAGASARRGWSA